MAELILTTFDWVPQMPRGYVRDLRVRWALEEAQLPYRVETVAFDERTLEHFAHQPFGQVPWLTDGERSIFESGAILLHLGERSTALLPAQPAMREEAVQWLFAALNSVEMVSQPWVLFRFMETGCESGEWKLIDGWLKTRLSHVEAILSAREWLTSRFSVADIAMSDVLRVIDRFDGLAGYSACQAYVARAVARPSFAKAHADQLAHFAAADDRRA